MFKLLSPPCIITLCCWVLHVSNDSFYVDVDYNETVTGLKEAIVKKKPVAFANTDADELTLWKVSGLSPVPQIYTHKFLARCLSGALNSLPSLSANNSSPTKILYWEQIACLTFSHHLNPLKGLST